MSNMMISILVPIYNVEESISNCVDSIGNQTYDNFEVVFVDDCTPDNSMCILEEKLKICSFQYKIIRHNKNKGLAGARNSGLKYASGKYIMFLDSDDYLPKNALFDYVDILRKDGKDADIIIGNYISNINNSFHVVKVSGSSVASEYLNRSIVRYLSFNLWGKLYNKDIFNNLHFIEGINMGEDYLMFNKVLKFSKRIEYTNTPTYVYNTDSNDESYTNNISIKSVEEMYASQLALIDFYAQETFMLSSNAKMFVDALKITCISSFDSFAVADKLFSKLSFSSLGLKFVDKLLLLIAKLKVSRKFKFYFFKLMMKTNLMINKI